MPLDSLGFTIPNYVEEQTDALERMGIVPIPRADVLTYKKMYRENWRLDNAKRAYYQVQTWKTVRQPKRAPLEHFLQYPTQFRRYSNDSSSTPKALVDLAMRVHEELPEATFTVDYFDVDPILHVHYDGKKACLGIWDQGIVKIIAQS